ncbi:hypothetical protein [Streptomyces shaanxiensis]|uniref:Uncharacterized protein n=1 Tax=Streptomyces shaanxiensis TaxID=653357 RepID=A0ABP7VC59_9ACTN
MRTTLYRNGRKAASNAGPLTGEKVFKVLAGEAEYTLTTSARRSARVQAASTRVDASWTFHSKAPSSGLPTELPVSTVRFAPKTGLDSRVEVGRTGTYPVTVEGAARGRNLKSRTVYGIDAFDPIARLCGAGVLDLRGMTLGRLDLSSGAVRLRLAVVGPALIAFGYAVSWLALRRPAVLRTSWPGFMPRRGCPEEPRHAIGILRHARRPGARRITSVLSNSAECLARINF